jgi:thiamine pyrophosphokinase
LVAGSELRGALDVALLETADLLVAVDGGADALARVGVRPHLLVGDLDSISLQTRAALEAQGVEMVLLPIAKDVTDTEAALRRAVGRGADDIVVLGALGGPRLDHLVGNLLLLTSDWLAGRQVRLVDEWHEAFLAGGEARIAGERGDTVSLLPLTTRVEDVSTEGLLYPLSGETLRRSATRGLSNAMTGDEARVTHGKGRLLVIHYRGR